MAVSVRRSPTWWRIVWLACAAWVCSDISFGQAQGGLSRTPAVASTSSQGQVPWGSLTPQQRRELQQLQKEWPSLSADRQQKWLEVAARMPLMSNEERSRVRERMFEWAQMSPAQRGQARLQFQEVRQWPADDRQAKWEAYLALTDDERTALAGQANRGDQQSVSGSATQKKNTVSASAPGLNVKKPVAPTVVQIKPGATTQLVSKVHAPPSHHQPGMPKIVATSTFVDPKTLLPKRGPQAAAMAGWAIIDQARSP
ncbi:MAG: DUF3106 domain-containing protein [Betaproteobacteria bacterium]